MATTISTLPGVTLRVRKTYVLEVEGPMAAGYVWSIRIGGRAVEKVGEQVVTSPSSSVAGGPGGVRYTLAGTRPGVSQITLTLSRPWQPQLPAIEIRTLEITVEP